MSSAEQFSNQAAVSDTNPEKNKEPLLPARRLDNVIPLRPAQESGGQENEPTQDTLRRARIAKVFATGDLGFFSKSSVEVSQEERIQAASQMKQEVTFQAFSAAIQQSVSAPFTMDAEGRMMVPQITYEAIVKFPELDTLMEKIYPLIFEGSTRASAGSDYLTGVVQRFPLPQQMEACVREKSLKNAEKEHQLSKGKPGRIPQALEMEKALGLGDLTQDPHFDKLMDVIYGKRQAYWRNMKILRAAAFQQKQKRAN